MADVEQVAFARRTIHGWELIVADGDLTEAALDPLRTAVNAAVESGADHVVIDLVGVRSATSACLHVLADTDAQLRGRRGELRLVIDGVPLLHAIREAGLSGRFLINRYVGDIVGGVAGIDEDGRGRRHGRTRSAAPLTGNT